MFGGTLRNSRTRPQTPRKHRRALKILLPQRGGSGRRRVSRRFSRNSSPSEGRLWEAARLASLLKKFLSFGGAALGGGASRVAFQEIPLPQRGGSGRRRVSRRFSRNSSPSEGRLWEAARLASLLKKFLSFGGAALGGGASRVAFQEIPLLRRDGSGRRRVSRRFSRNSSPSEGQLWEAARLASLFLNPTPTPGECAVALYRRTPKRGG